MAWLETLAFVAFLVALVCDYVRIGVLEDRVTILANKVKYLLDRGNPS